MTGNCSMLHHSPPYQDPDSGQLGNGDELSVSHSGTTALFLANSTFKLNNVYVIPSMRKNLLSISQFCTDNNVLCAFDAHHFYIFDLVSRSLLFQGQCRDGLYKLPSPHQLKALSASHT